MEHYNIPEEKYKHILRTPGEVLSDLHYTPSDVE